MLGAAQAHDVADLGAAAGERRGEPVVGAEEDAALLERGIDAAEAAIDVEGDGAERAEGARHPRAHALAQPREALGALHQRAHQRELDEAEVGLEAGHLAIGDGPRAGEGALGVALRRAQAGDEHVEQGAGSSRQRGVASSASRTARSPYISRKCSMARRPGPAGRSAGCCALPARRRSHAAASARTVSATRASAMPGPALSSLAHAADEGLRQRLGRAEVAAAHERRVAVGGGAARRGAALRHALEQKAEREVPRERRRRAREHQRAGAIEEGARALQRGGEAVVGQQGEIHVGDAAERAIGLGLEGGDVVLQPRLPRELPRRRQRQLHQERAVRDVVDLLLQRGDHRVVGAAARRQERARRQAGHLRRDLHERGEVQVEAPVHVADEARAAGHVAPERAERLAKALVGEGSRDRPRQRSRRAWERLAHVGARPGRLRVAAFGEAVTGDRPRLEEPHLARLVGPRVLHGELHVPRAGAALVEAIGEPPEHVQRLCREGRLARAPLVHGGLFHAVIADDEGQLLVGDRCGDDRPRAPREAHGVDRSGAVDDRRAEAERDVDQPLVGAPLLALEAGRRRGEEHARGLGEHHDLEDHGHAQLAHAGVAQVGERPRVERAGPHLTDRRGDGLGPARAEHRRGEAGERRLLAILGGRARSRREAPRCVRLDRAPELLHRRHEPARERQREHAIPRPRRVIGAGARAGELDERGEIVPARQAIFR